MKTEHVSFYSRDELELLGFSKIGASVLVSRFARFYGIEYISLSNHVRIDDFCVISVGSPSSFGNYVHIGTTSSIHCPKGFIAKDFSGVSPGARILGVSNDFSAQFLMHPSLPTEFRKVTESQMTLSRFSQVGANSVLLPNSFLAEGSVLGANSLLKSPTAEWKIYAGCPAREVGVRNRVTSFPQV
jgi:acetyltransferase-like isoleucine patch superfamily enzyme